MMTLYHKPTAGNIILHLSSFHPRPLVLSIPYGQFLRICHKCSSDEDFKREAEDLRDRLLVWGYSRKCLKRAYNRVVTQLRHCILLGNQRKQTQSQTLIPRFTMQRLELRDILEKYWYILQADPRLQSAIS